MDRERVGRIIAGCGAGACFRECQRAEGDAEVAAARGLDALAEAERFAAEGLSEASLLICHFGIAVADGRLNLTKLKRMNRTLPRTREAK